jgi:glutathione S-transferase
LAFFGPTERAGRCPISGANGRGADRLASQRLDELAFGLASPPARINVRQARQAASTSVDREQQEDGAMKLYYAPGTISVMPHVALLESGLCFVAVRVDEASKKMADGGDYNAINPLGYVPALVLDDGSVLLEAAAIAQYIADRDSTGKLAPPPATIARARLQAWLNFLSSEMHKGGLGPLFYPALDERAKDVFRERLKARFAFVDQHLSTHEYLLGKDYSIADIGLYAMTGWTPRVGFDIHAYPNLVAHHARIANRGAVREVQRIEGPIPA